MEIVFACIGRADDFRHSLVTVGWFKSSRFEHVNLIPMVLCIFWVLELLLSHLRSVQESFVANIDSSKKYRLFKQVLIALYFGRNILREGT